MTTQLEATRELLERALQDPELAPSGPPCRYVRRTDDGSVCRCIVGTMLHLIGVDDKHLEFGYPENAKSVKARGDFHPIIREHGLDLEAMDDVQRAWDQDESLDAPNHVRRILDEYELAHGG